MARSRRSSNQPLSLSKASNSLLFTTTATRSYQQSAPAPEPIGKRSNTTSSLSYGSTSTFATEIMLLKNKERMSGYDDYGVRRPRSRPASIRSSRRSSVRSGRSRNAHVQRKQSSETVQSRVSIASSRLSAGFSRLIMEEPASLTNIPTELVHSIVRYLTRADLLNLICVCQQLRSETTMLLYAKPYFKSTYRFAQFVTTVSHNQKLAELVRELDLSHIAKLPRNSGLAEWREWKYRSELLYSIYPGQETEGGNTNGPDTPHPLAHPLLAKYSTGGRDVPLGSLMHIVKACSRLRYLLLGSKFTPES